MRSLGHLGVKMSTQKVSILRVNHSEGHTKVKLRLTHVTDITDNDLFIHLSRVTLVTSRASTQLDNLGIIEELRCTISAGPSSARIRRWRRSRECINEELSLSYIV